MPDSDLRRIEELLSRSEAKVRRTFARFLQDARSPAIIRRVREALEGGGVAAGLDIIEEASRPVGEVISELLEAAGDAEARALRRIVGSSREVLSFDPASPRAAAIIRRSRLEFVAEFSRQQRLVTRAALSEALQTGAGPVEVARAIRDSIGLTEAQRQAVLSYRRLLEAGDAAALERDLRDRRFDGSVLRAARGDEPLTEAMIKRMVDRYRARYLQYRAETIARTESVRALGQARQESLQQVVEGADIPKSWITRVWRSTRDKRVRDTHMAMDGQERGLDAPFQSPSGARLMVPGDGSLGAPAEEIINCRCVVLVRVSPPK